MSSPTPVGSPPKVGKQRHTKSCKRCSRRKQRCHGFPVCRACDEARVPCEPSAYAVQLHAQDSNVGRVGSSNGGGNGGGNGGSISSGGGGHASLAALQRIQALETQLAGALTELAIVRQQQQQQQQQQQPYPPNPFFVSSSRPAEPLPLIFADAAEASTGMPDLVEQMVQSTVWSKGLFSVGDGAPPVSPLSPGSPMASLTSFSAPLQQIPPIAHLSPPPPPPPQTQIQTQIQTQTQTHIQSPLPSPPSAAPTASLPPPPPRPTDAMGRRMIEAYFSKIHPRYPILDRSELYQLHESAQKHAATPPVTFSASSSPSLTQRFQVFRLNMVYAIGGTLLKITDPLCEAQAETYLAVALRDVAVVQDAQAHSQRQARGSGGSHSTGPGTTLLTIEGLVLLVLYNLRAPTNTGIWYLTNLAMQTCIDLRLHMEASYHDAALSVADKRAMRRLFWSAYVLDRFIALSFKRPFSIAENDIDTALPDSTTTEGPMWPRFLESKRLESRIQTSLYGLGELHEQRRQKIAPLLAEVDAWGRSISCASSSSSSSSPTTPSSGQLTPSEVVYLQLQWNSAVAQILRPFLSTMDRNDPLLVRCLHASGNVCALFKAMHMREAYGHSFVSAHLLFIAGITMCYCLFRVAAPPSLSDVTGDNKSSDHDDNEEDSLARLFDARVAAHLRACSSSMFIIAERYHRLRKHRDILEDIIGRLMEARMRCSSGSGGGGGIRGDHHKQILILPAAALPPAQASTLPSSGDDQFSQRDFVAVQSLLNLAAQQEPETCTSPAVAEATRATTATKGTSITGDSSPPPPPTTTAGPATAEDITASSALMLSSLLPPVSDYLLHPALELDLAATGSWDVDRYSLEMLGRMIEPG